MSNTDAVSSNTFNDTALLLIIRALKKAVDEEDTDAIQGGMAKLLMWSEEADLKKALSTSAEAKTLGDIMALTWHVLKRSAQVSVKTLLDDVRLLERYLSQHEKSSGFEEKSSGYMSPAIKPVNAQHKILLVDRDALVLKHLAYQFQSVGYDVITRRSIDELTHVIDTEAPSVIVMDVMASNDTLVGPNFMEAINAGHTPPIPTLFMSERDDFEARLHCVRASAHAFLVKPFDFAQLLDQVSQFTGQTTHDPYRVLAVDDDKLMLKIIRFNLENAGIIVETTTNPKHAMDLMYDLRPDVLITDLNMPECSGIELARMIRQLKTFVSTPIVFLTAETDPEHTADALLKGGDAYITKPVETNHLIDVVRTCAAKSRDIRSMMFEDDLTGLYNPMAMRETLCREVIRANRTGDPLALLMLDIDHLKRINDTYGHPAGDRLLKAFASFLQGRLRRTDWIGRGNSEEFAVIMPNTSVDNAIKIMEVLRKAFADMKHQCDQGTFKVTFSGGVVECPTGLDVAHLFNLADMALFDAKQAGRNQIKASK